MSEYRYIGDVNDPTIKNADELIVWCYKDNTFIKVNSLNFPINQNNTCMICPKQYKAKDGVQYSCKNTINNWVDFKCHISNAEKIFGELIAFPLGFESLPDKSNYQKFRNYGHFHPYQKKNLFLIFDIKQNKFIRVERNRLVKIYTKRGRCSYCPCIRRLKSSIDVLRHISVFEKKFYCFLIINNLSQNDEKNQNRIQEFVNFTKFDLEQRRSNRIKNQKEKKVFEESLVGSTVHNEGVKDKHGKNLLILEELKEFHKNNLLAIESYIDKLKSNLDLAVDLNKSIIDAQDAMVLKIKNENIEEKTKNYIYKLPLNLSYNDLDILMKKTDITEDFEIVKAEINLDLHFESISNKTHNGNKNLLLIENSKISSPKFKPKPSVKDASFLTSRLSNDFCKTKTNQQVNVCIDNNDVNCNLFPIECSKISNQKSKFESKSFVKDSPRFTINLPNDYYKTDGNQQMNLSVDKNDLEEKRTSEEETESLTNDESIINEELVHDEFFDQLKTEDESMDEELFVNNDDLSIKRKLISNDDKYSLSGEKSTDEELMNRDAQLKNNHIVYIDEDSIKEVISLTSLSHKLDKQSTPFTDEIKKTKIEREFDPEDSFSNSTHSADFKKARYV